MWTRRQFLWTAAGLSAGTVAYAAWNLRQASNRYDRAIAELWRHTSRPAVSAEAVLNREMVRYATLAPSSHNTQCWKFAIENQAVSILPDWSRRCPVVDPDDHHLWVSLGCAAENLVLAARAFGRHPELQFDSAAGDRLRIQLAPGSAERSALFDAIPLRQSTRAEYSGQTAGRDLLKTLEAAGRGNGVELRLLTEKKDLEKILAYVVEGNTAQMSDPAFTEELKAWIRFGSDEAVRRGDGLFARSSGNPAAPRWLGLRLFDLFFSVQNENDKYARQIRSSAGIAVFASDRNTREQWVEAGRCFERFALQATALGMKTAFINQPVEVIALRPRFASDLGLGDRRPDLVVRFGYAPDMPRSLRRPLDDVLL